MGIIVDTIVADVRNAKKTFEPGSFRPDWKRYPWIETPGLSTGMLASLLRLLDKRYKKADWSEDFPEVYEEDECRWVYKYPDRLVELLAKMDAESVSPVTKLWMKADRGFKGWDKCDAEQVVQNLRTISQKAMRSKKPLLLRVTL